MKRTLIIQTIDKIDKHVLLKGWVNVVRDHGRFVFFELRDRTGTVQVFVPADLSAKISLNPEDVIELKGKVVKRPQKNINPEMKTGTVEVQAEEINITVKAGKLPFDTGAPKLNLDLPSLLDFRSLSLRHPSVSGIFKVQHTILTAFREALINKGFTEISVPTIVATATEGGAQVFPVKYFNHTAYLAQSPQFFKQIMVGVFERVFTTAHAYRAEPSVTTRHITEYVGLDAEMGFIKSWLDVLNMADYTVKQIFKAVQAECADELKFFNAILPKTADQTPRLQLKEALEIIFKRTGRDNRHEPDLSPEDEREICAWAEENGSEIVFVTHYPTAKRPMYTYPDPENPDYTFSFDMIGRGVEWITGGQRINDYEQLVASMKKFNCDPGDFENPYLQAFKYGMPPEGGFCLGLERITQNILSLPNIRQATLFPRDMTRIDFNLASRKKK